MPCPHPHSHKAGCTKASPSRTLSSKMILHKGLPFSHPEHQTPAPKPGTESLPCQELLGRESWCPVPPREGTGTFTGWSQVTHGVCGFSPPKSAGAAAYVAAFKGLGRRRQVPARPAQNQPNLGKQVRAGRGQGAAPCAPGQGKQEEWGP